MLDRIKDTNAYQKIILIALLIATVVFPVIYISSASRAGFIYHDKKLVEKHEDNKTTYSGKIEGKKAVFTVDEDNTVVFQLGTKTYGPYIVKSKIDTSAMIINGKGSNKYLVEIYKGKSLLFSGSAMSYSEGYIVYNEDGTWYTETFYVDVNGKRTEVHSGIVYEDSMEPTVMDIIPLALGFEVVQKTEFGFMFFALFLTVVTILDMLFADELFRFRMSFKVYNVDGIEPSELEIFGRYVGWTIGLIAVLIFYSYGL